MAFEVRVPRLTQTMSEATITRWLKREGESIREGEPLFEAVTDKATVEVESPATGILGRILVREGEVPVGTVIAVLVAPGEQLPTMVTQVAATGPAQAQTPTQRPESSQEQKAAPGRIRVSPVARKLAQSRGVDLARVTPTGPGGLITETDVRQWLEAEEAAAERAPATPVGEPQAAPPPADGEEVIPLQGVRRTIAERLSLSKRTAADVTTVAEVDMDEIAGLREHLEFTYTSFVARAVAIALAEFPILNSRLEEGRIVVSKRVHLGVAVDIDDGLKVPVIRDAHTKSLRQISAELAELAKRAAEGRLTPEELAGSTFTLTNSGVFGSLLFTPIINPPESAILGMGKIAKTPVVRDDQIVIRRMMYLCLTYDHRVVDGAPAVRFLQRVKALLEKPALLL